MLRIYCLQQWFGLSDPAAEEAIYDRNSFQRFLSLDIVGENVPEETTILNFRHGLETHRLTEAIFAEIGTHLAQKGLTMKTGTIVDAPLIAAPSSTKNAVKKRDQQMSSTRKANQWHFGMEASVGVDAGSGLVHSVATTTASVHDSQVMQEVLHGEEKVILSEKGMPTTRAHGKRGRAGFVGASWTKPNESNPCRANSNRATGTGPACGRRSNTPFE